MLNLPTLGSLAETEGCPHRVQIRTSVGQIALAPNDPVSEREIFAGGYLQRFPSKHRTFRGIRLPIIPARLVGLGSAIFERRQDVVNDGIALVIGKDRIVTGGLGVLGPFEEELPN